jgi:ferritin heavy chain
MYEQAWYFDRDDVALKGFHKFFSESSKEEREHAEKLIKYQNRRGGKVVLQQIDVSNESKCWEISDSVQACYLMMSDA